MAAKSQISSQVSDTLLSSSGFLVDLLRVLHSNDWNVLDPRPAVKLLESWSPLLPRFMRDNVLNQLILPKISSQVGEWNPRRQRPGSEYSLASIVFPWLSVLQDRFDGVLDEAKVRIGETMKRWSVKESIPDEWKLWRDVSLCASVFRYLLLTVFATGVLQGQMGYVDAVKHCSEARSPHRQRLRGQPVGPEDGTIGSCVTLERPLTRFYFCPNHRRKVLPDMARYTALLVDPAKLQCWRSSFLVSRDGDLPKPSTSVLSRCYLFYRYHFWKEHFANYNTSKGDRLTESKGIDHGFRAGLSLMNDAMILGADAPNRLVKPTFVPLPDKKSSDKKSKLSSRGRTAAFAQPTESEVTFRSIAEQYAADRNLLFIPTGRSHTTTGKQLFKVAPGLDARGVTVYVGDDAVYAQVKDGSFRAVLLDDMVKMASA
jgi:tuftelin-interacting protein 11